MVEFFDPVSQKNISYYIESRLAKNLDRIKEKLMKKDKDYVCIIDGPEGSGKSVLGMQVAKYVDPTLCLDRICMSPQQFKEAIVKAQKNQAVIFDEAFTGLGSRSSLSEINRMLVSMMMQMRQKNLFVVVILPNVFMLDKYVALSRGRALIHVWEKNDHHYWRVFNRVKLKQLILTGAKTYSYSKVSKYISFIGHFFGKYVIDENSYREKKRKALEETEIITKEPKYLTQRNKLFKILKTETKYSNKKISELCKAIGFDMGDRGVDLVLAQFKEIPRIPSVENVV